MSLSMLVWLGYAGGVLARFSGLMSDKGTVWLSIMTSNSPGSQAVV